jgi:O-antigen/teichoic acid export membrane protein
VLVGAVVAVALAAEGLGAMAVVIGGIAQAVATTLLLIAASPPLAPRWSSRSQREITAFGIPAALTALVGTLFSNIDYAILAARLPATQAGYYWRAFNVGVVYQDKLSRIMTQIAFPVYSRTSDREQMRRLHERVARMHAVVIFPLLATLVALAPILVPLVFGPAWKPAVVPTQILAVAGMVAAILTGYPQLMLAIGRPRSLLYFLISVLLVYATAVTAASGHGLVVVCTVVACVYIGILVGAYRFLLQRYVGISIRRLLPELGPAIVGCLALLPVTVSLSHLLGPIFPRVLTVGISGAGGLLVYALVVRGAFPAAWADVRELVVRVVPPAGRIARRRTSPAPAPAP